MRAYFLDRCTVASTVFFLALLTAVLVLEEVDWAGVGGQDQHHLVTRRPSHLQQDGDRRQLWRGGDSGWRHQRNCASNPHSSQQPGEFNPQEILLYVSFLRHGRKWFCVWVQIYTHARYSINDFSRVGRSWLGFCGHSKTYQRPEQVSFSKQLHSLPQTTTGYGQSLSYTSINQINWKMWTE